MFIIPSSFRAQSIYLYIAYHIYKQSSRCLKSITDYNQIKNKKKIKTVSISECSICEGRKSQKNI